MSSKVYYIKVDVIVCIIKECFMIIHTVYIASVKCTPNKHIHLVIRVFGIDYSNPILPVALHI